MREDTEGSLELSRRGVLSGILSMGAASTAAGAGTMALFSDTETSSGNTIQAGTIDLQAEEGFETPYSIENATPGSSDAVGDLNLEFNHVGTIQADHLEFAVQNYPHEDRNGDLTSDDSGPESDSQSDSAEGMSKHIRVRKLQYYPPNSSQFSIVLDGQPVSVSGRPDIQIVSKPMAFVSLYDLAAPANSDALDEFTPPVLGGNNSSVSMTVEVAETMPNGFQGDVLETTFSATLNQADGQ